MKRAALAILLVSAAAHAERAPVVLEVALDVPKGLTVSKDAAVIVDIAPAAGLTVKKRRLGRADAVDPAADVPRFSIPVRGDASGAVELRLRYWVCGAHACRPVDVRRTETVVITED